MAAKKKPAKAKPEKTRRLAPARRPFSHHTAQNAAVNLQARVERKKAEHANQYRLEYNNIVGMAHTAGATAQNLHAVAMRNFVAMHGERHLPK
jgi:hypothetical protein